MNTRRTFKWIFIVAFSGLAASALLMLPRTRTLPEGYTYVYFPAGGHRYILSPDSTKKVGQEVLNYHVSGTLITGTVRLLLEHDDIRSFRLDLKTHKLTLGERVPSDTP